MKQANIQQVGMAVGVSRVLKHYDSQTEDEAIAEDEAAFELKDQAVMIVPKKLVSFAFGYCR